MVSLYVGDCLEVLPTLESGSVNCVVTSPPYWGLRDYGAEGQLGLEPTPELYVTNLVAVFREVRRVLHDDGTLWLVLGDSYAAGGSGPTSDKSTLRGNGHVGGGPKVKSAVAQHHRPAPGLASKQLVGIPWRVAFALQADGWYLRSEIIWAKPNPMPESVTDRPTKAHEQVFLLTKAARYWYDAEAIKEASAEVARPQSDKRMAQRMNRGVVVCGELGQTSKGVDGGLEPTHIMRSGLTVNRRTVWTIATQPFPEAHFATYPEKLVEPCVLAGCPVGGTVLDPFCGSGTTGAVAYRLGREFIGIELNEEYAEMAERRIAPHRDQMQMEVQP
jgi:DNA modification methylase